MKWFKHYSNANTNSFVDALLNEKNGDELHSKWWLLLELLASEFKENTTEFYFSEQRLLSALRIKYSNKLERILKVFANFSETFDKDLINFSESFDKVSRKIYKISTPIMLELIGKDFKRTRKRGVYDDSKKKEERTKNKELSTTTTTQTEFSDVLNEIVERYNKIADIKKLEKVDLNDKNMTRYNEKIKRDFAEAYLKNPSIDFWRKVVTGILSDSFYYSGNNDTAWRINFSYLTKIDKAEKLFSSYNRNLENINIEYRIESED